MLTQPRRLLSAAVAILLGVGFVAAALFLGGSLTGTIERAAAGSIGDAAVVVSRPAPSDRAAADSGQAATDAMVTPAYAAAVRGVPGVTGTRELINRPLVQDLGSRRGPVAAKSLPPAGSDTRVTAGRLPEKPGEVAINDALADARKVGVGADIRLGRDWEGATVTARVVGVVAPGAAEDAGGMPSVYAANADLMAWSGTSGYDELDVTGDGRDNQALRDAVAAAPGGQGLTVRTAAAETAERVRQATNETATITGLLLGFAAISVLVSAIVIANTFAILVAQRVRELALLRCVGATRRQVFRSVLGEALVLSLVASAAGIALGAGVVGVIAWASRGSRLALVGPRPDLVSILVPLLVGVVVTVVAAVVPARRATRVAPLAALRPELAAPTGTRAGRVRIGFGLLAVAAGLAVLVLGARAHALGAAILGGAASLVGVVLLGSLVVPPLARVLGAVPARLAGLPGRLAVDNSRRNPGRAAATASALFVGVTLITLMSVGAASGAATIDRELNRHAPVDAIVSSTGELPATTYDAVTHSPVVAKATRGASAPVVLAWEGAAGTERHLTATGVGADARAVVRYAEFVDGVAPDTVLLATSVGVPDGAMVTLRGDGTAAGAAASVALRAVVREDGPTGPVVAIDTLRRIAPNAHTVIWVRYAAGEDPIRANERLAADLAGVPGLQVGGAAQQRAEVERLVAVVLYVVTGLLAVAVVIALVGVGNTLGLSVLERTRESGLLRALGVTRRQLRGMLGIEALTLAGVGAALGIVLGIGYGVAGAHALMGADMPVVVAIPWARLALVAVVAIGAGWLASVVPGHRAAKVPPSAALATE